MRYLPLALLLSACGAEPSPSAGVDAARLDVAADAAGDAVAVGDVTADAAPDAPMTPDAAPDAAVGDAAVDAADVAVDVAADAPTDAPVTMPSQSDLVPMQIWLSINGGSFTRLTSGRCYRAANNNVMIAAPSVIGTVGVTAAGARASVTLQCPGAIDDGFIGLRHTAFRDGSGSIVAVNTGASARVMPPTACGDSPVVVERFEVQAFGCGPMSP